MLAASAHISPLGNTPQCVEANGDIEYWVNMAADAHGHLKMVSTGKMIFTELTVNGAARLGGLSGDNSVTIPGNLKVDGVAELNAGINFQKSIFNDQGELETNTQTQNLRLTIQGLEQRILELEYKIANLCTNTDGC